MMCAALDSSCHVPFAQIQEAVSSLTGAKGVASEHIRRVTGLPEDEAEAHAVNEHSVNDASSKATSLLGHMLILRAWACVHSLVPQTDVVLGLLSNTRSGERSAEDDALEQWSESETHEVCHLLLPQ